MTGLRLPVGKMPEPRITHAHFKELPSKPESVSNPPTVPEAFPEPLDGPLSLGPEPLPRINEWFAHEDDDCIGGKASRQPPNDGSPPRVGVEFDRPSQAADNIWTLSEIEALLA